MKDNYQLNAPSRAAEGLVQNFIIVLPNAGAVTDMAGGTQTESVLHAIRTALGMAAAPETRSPVRGTTLEEVAIEWFRNNVTSWAPSYAGRLKNRLETGLLEHR